MYEKIKLSNGVNLINYSFIPKKHLKITEYDCAKNPVGFKISNFNFKIDGSAKYEDRNYWIKIRNYKSGLLTDVNSYTTRDGYGKEINFEKPGEIVVLINENLKLAKVLTRESNNEKEQAASKRSLVFMDDIKQCLV